MTTKVLSVMYVVLTQLPLSAAAGSPFGFHPAGVFRPDYPDVGFIDAQNIGVRWHRPPVYAFWFLVQPDLNVSLYDWTALDGQYGSVPAGVSILANIAPDGPGGSRCLPGSWIPVDIPQYTAFVEATVERYDGDGLSDMPGLTNPVKHWQVGNEPAEHFISDFASLQQISYGAIKAACPDCTVLIGGAGGFPDSYINGFDTGYAPILADLAGQAVDVLDFHWYGTATGEYRLKDTASGQDVLDHIRSTLTAAGFAPDLPVWITEMGSYSGDPPPSPLPPFAEFPPQTERQQAGDYFKRFLYPLSRGVQKVFPAFGLMEGFVAGDRNYFDHTGLIYNGIGAQDPDYPDADPDDLGLGVKKLSYYTYKKMTEKLEGADWSTVALLRDGTATDHLYLVRVIKDGRAVYAAWWDTFDEPGYVPGDTKDLVLTGLTGDIAVVTSVVPSAALGRDATDYDSAFAVAVSPIVAGSVTLSLGEDPVIVETRAAPWPPDPIYLVVNNHVEGDLGFAEGDPACLALMYQTEPLPPPGPQWPAASFALDTTGTELIRQILDGHTDALGRQARMLVCPAGEFWQTEADATYGGQLFNVYDYLALGDEFGIQGHGIYYSGQSFCWYNSAHTAQGIAMKLTDLHIAAQTVTHNGQPVNAGLTLTGGAKLESPALGTALTESLIDHVAFGLGYRVSYEDHDGHVEDEPPGINNRRCSYYLHHADYGDGTRMLKIDMNGSLNDFCEGNTARCETSSEAIARFDATLAARADDPDARRVYYHAFATHAGGVWADYNRAAAGLPMNGEGAALLTFMDAVQARIGAGTQVLFATPAELKTLYVVPGDLDGDWDIDLTDYSAFAGCLTGPAGGPLGAGCSGGDFDADNDADLADFAAFQEALASSP